MAVVACGGRTQPPGRVPTSATKPAERRVEGVDHFGHVSDHLWRGNSPTGEGYRSLVAMGVKTIVSLRSTDTADRVPPGVTYVAVPAPGWDVDELDIPRVLDAIEQSPKPVFIHCRQGRDRTGLAVAAYRLSRGASLDEAVRELDQFGVNPWHRPAIVKRLRELAASPASASRPARRP